MAAWPQLPPREQPPLRTFCGYCVQAAEAPGAQTSRVCPRCSMGLLLSAPADSVPLPGDALLIVDDLMRIRAVSRSAERLLQSPETTLVGRYVGDVLSAAEAAITDGFTPSSLIATAMRDETSRPSTAVRLRGRYGRCFRASIVGCRPAPAALLRLEAMPAPGERGRGSGARMECLRAG